MENKEKKTVGKIIVDTYGGKIDVIEVNGEALIERQIRQLHEAGITDITVMVGYMKEKFRYLVDKFGVTVVDNDDYHRYNNGY